MKAQWNFVLKIRPNNVGDSNVNQLITESENFHLLGDTVLK